MGYWISNNGPDCRNSSNSFSMKKVIMEDDLEELDIPEKFKQKLRIKKQPKKQVKKNEQVHNQENSER